MPVTLSDNALCTLEEVINFGEMSIDDDKDNDIIRRLINGTTTAFHTIAGIEQFKAKNYTEYLDGTGNRYLRPTHFPINSVISIYDDTDWGFEDSTLIDSSYYRIVRERYIVLKNTVFTEFLQNIKITYNAGYNTIPEDIKQLCIEVVSSIWRRKAEIDVSSRADQFGNVTYIEKFIPKHAKDILTSPKYGDYYGVA